MDRYQLFETVERLTGKTLVESELDEICGLLDGEVSDKQAKAQKLHPLYVAAPEMLELAKLILIAEAESHGGDYTSGICDCKDNDGKYYQSAFLCEALSKLAALVDKIEVNPTPAIDDF